MSGPAPLHRSDTWRPSRETIRARPEHSVANFVDILNTFTVVPIVRSLVRVGVPEAVPTDGFVETKEVAQKVGVDAEMLRRTIRCVAGFGVFHEEGDGSRFKHTGTSLTLLPGGELRKKVLYRASEEVVFPYIGGYDALLKDPSKSAFRHLHGEVYQTEWLPKRPDNERLYTEFMLEMSEAINPTILDAYQWPSEGIIADIGASGGHLLKALLAKWPSTTGVLFELPSVVEHAKKHWDEVGAGVSRDRVIFKGGDFFTAVDVVADVYILKWVLHEWPDDKCKRILDNIQEHAKPTSIIVAVDFQLRDDLPNQYQLSKMYDLHMAVTFGGKQRNAKDFAHLAAASGWFLQEICPIGDTPFGCHILTKARG